MKNKLLIVLVSLFLLNCTNNKKDSNVKSLFNLIQLQKSTTDNYYNGLFNILEFKEQLADNSQSKEVISKMKSMYLSMQEIEDLTQKSTDLITEIKINFLKNHNENLAIITNQKNNPSKFNYSEIKYMNNIELETKDISSLVENIKSFRNELCTILVTSHSTSEVKYTFDPFDITDYNDYENLSVKFDKEILKSNISLDDIGMVKHLYLLLTKSEEEWENILGGTSNWVEIFGILDGLTYDIYEARKIALSGIKSRISGSEFNFNKMEVLVNGPNVAKIGDTITLTLFMGAYNTDNQPIVKSESNENGLMIKDGKASLKYIIRNKKDMEYNGTISLISKSGDLKSFPWNHKVKVIQ